ncbi:MAG: hypothetical protein JGK24_01265 [Microcoleus sp. PH2017_29_MFU_D_A]|uniref:hypothetical protein n=1 Tax=unclassified Microcoleus TaxID=2642155 RepID=UPI001DA201C4|nr:MULTISPECIES: hypothetical protein [unclassified Microcoleus]MCC3452493.1 hypothetical protein [Microcoleus sp. PH2017_08_TRC_O_A]MCC3585393.1 hypothetical protein [Microcoleus sp. PH2017_30_WIL_O_A]MCC3601881.1 hypothetical protein [Microcoleus sp. PH2017_29_MFU_D_A]MCC3633108.1 hypothetical protein [Microcoleus sp. PH2017_37_MFU_D_B]
MFGIWYKGRSLFHFRRSVVRNKKGRSLLMRDRAIATRRMIAVLGIWCEGRSIFIDYLMRLLWWFST